MHTTTTVSFSAGLATLVVILAALGLYTLFKLDTLSRNIAVVLIVGILFNSIKVFRDIGNSLRGWVNNLGSYFHAWDWVSGAGFTLIILIAIAFTAKRDRKSEKGDNKWTWVTVILALLLFTISWAATAMTFILHWAPQVLDYIQKVNF